MATARMLTLISCCSGDDDGGIVISAGEIPIENPGDQGGVPQGKARIRRGTGMTAETVRIHQKHAAVRPGVFEFADSGGLKSGGSMDGDEMLAFGHARIDMCGDVSDAGKRDVFALAVNAGDGERSPPRAAQREVGALHDFRGRKTRRGVENADG